MLSERKYLPKRGDETDLSDFGRALLGERLQLPYKLLLRDRGASIEGMSILPGQSRSYRVAPSTEALCVASIGGDPRFCCRVESATEEDGRLAQVS